MENHINGFSETAKTRFMPARIKDKFHGDGGKLIPPQGNLKLDHWAAVNHYLFQ